MKHPLKRYEAPELICYGDLAQVTAFDADDSPEDFYYFSQSAGIPGTGSNNGCVTSNLETCEL